MNSNVAYQELCPIGTSVHVRRKFNVGDIFENKAKCLKCNDIIVSTNRHDFVTCSCKSLSVDGGSWYLKRLFVEEESWEELSTFYRKE